MERLNTHIGAANSSLQETPKVLHTVSVDRAVNVLLSVVNHLVRVFGVKPVVGEQFIRHDFRTAPNVLADDAGKLMLPARLNVLQVDASGIPFEQAEHNLLADRTATVDLGFPLVFVHETGFATYKSLISFDRAGHLIDRAVVLGKANAVQHKPCGLLSYLKSLADLIAGHSILTVAEHPHSSEPLVQSYWRVFKDRTDLDRELLPALKTSPSKASLDKGQSFGFATRTFGTVRPFDFGNRFKANHWVRKVLNCFHQTTLSVEVNRFHKPILLLESV